MTTRDEMFETIFECWTGRPYDDSTKATVTSSMRGRINTVAKELRAVGATPDDVRVRWEIAKQRWPGITITPQTLATHWATLEAPPARASTADQWLHRRRA